MCYYKESWCCNDKRFVAQLDKSKDCLGDEIVARIYYRVKTLLYSATKLVVSVEI